MAVKVNDSDLQEYDGDFTKETQIIEAGPHPARLVSYVELGKHYPIYQGKRKVYESGKRKDEEKPEALLIHLVFEFPNCEFDNVPLTIKTSVPYGDKGDFINELSVSDSLASGNISLSFANRSGFMKYKNAMNAATGANYPGLDSHVGSPFIITVTNKAGTKADADGNLPVYSNMKPDGIQKTSFRNPGTGKTEEVEVPEIQGEYCPVFDWDEPAKESWDLVPEYLQKTIKKAVNFPGSPIQLLLLDYPEGNTDPDTPEENKPPTSDAAPAQTDDIPV